MGAVYFEPHEISALTTISNTGKIGNVDKAAPYRSSCCPGVEGRCPHEVARFWLDLASYDRDTSPSREGLAVGVRVLAGLVLTTTPQQTVRRCDCGCGEEVVGRSDKRFVNGTHEARKRRRIAHDAKVAREATADYVPQLGQDPEKARQRLQDMMTSRYVPRVFDEILEAVALVLGGPDGYGDTHSSVQSLRGRLPEPGADADVADMSSVDFLVEGDPDAAYQYRQDADYANAN
jgi:hypothetical protein